MKRDFSEFHLLCMLLTDLLFQTVLRPIFVGLVSYLRFV